MKERTLTLPLHLPQVTSIPYLVDSFNEMYEREFLKESNPAKRVNYPFPIAVYGTLRSLPVRGSNSPLMYAQQFAGHSKAFLPHFKPDRSRSSFQRDFAGTFEIYYYLPNAWKEVIGPIDRLEGYDPSSRSGYYWIRTLVRMSILPESFSSRAFETTIHEPEYLNLPPSEWAQYPTVPVWIYSNATVNEQLKEVENSPFLWQ